MEKTNKRGRKTETLEDKQFRTEFLDWFCATLKARRNELKLTQRDVAAELKVNRFAYQQIEQGFMMPSPLMQLKLAKVLGLKSGVIFGEEKIFLE